MILSLLLKDFSGVDYIKNMERKYSNTQYDWSNIIELRMVLEVRGKNCTIGFQKINLGSKGLVVWSTAEKIKTGAKDGVAASVSFWRPLAPP
jgi:hypothetical protein